MADEKRNLKVLIVDDAFFIRNIIKKAIMDEPPGDREYSFSVCGEAKNGREGMVEYFKMKPDLVTLDINMPEVDGIEVAKEIIAKEPGAKIIVVTGNKDESIKSRILATGVRAYLEKPLNQEVLWNELDALAREIVYGIDLKNEIEEEEAVEPIEITSESAEEDDSTVLTIENEPDVKETSPEVATVVVEEPAEEKVEETPIMVQIIEDDEEDDLLAVPVASEPKSPQKTPEKKMEEPEEILEAEELFNPLKTENPVEMEKYVPPAEENILFDIDMNVAFDIDKVLPKVEITLPTTKDIDISLPLDEPVVIEEPSVEEVPEIPSVKEPLKLEDEFIIEVPAMQSEDDLIVVIDDSPVVDKGKTANGELNIDKQKYNSLENKESNGTSDKEELSIPTIAPPRSKILREMYSETLNNQYKGLLEDSKPAEVETNSGDEKGLLKSLKKLFNKK